MISQLYILIFGQLVKGVTENSAVISDYVKTIFLKIQPREPLICNLYNIVIYEYE